MQHVIFKTLFGDKLALAPIGENPKHVLDMATGMLKTSRLGTRIDLLTQELAFGR